LFDAFGIWVTQPGPAILWTALGFFAGTLVGHFLSIDRDRRKEFNELADPIRLRLRNALTDLRFGAHRADSEALSALIDITPAHCRRRFSRAIANYYEALAMHITIDSVGQPHYSQTDHLKQPIHQLLFHLKRR